MTERCPTLPIASPAAAHGKLWQAHRLLSRYPIDGNFRRLLGNTWIEEEKK
jgi:hypothetical protein